MLMHNFINKITVIVLWARINCKSKMAKSFCTRRQNGHELFNPIFEFLLSYKFTPFIMKIMFEILK